MQIKITSYQAHVVRAAMSLREHELYTSSNASLSNLVASPEPTPFPMVPASVGWGWASGAAGAAWYLRMRA